MPTLETTLTQKGQVTIPKEIRDALGLKPQDKVLFELDGDTARIRRAPSRILAIFGAVRPIRKPEDLREIREEFEEGVADEVLSEG